MSDVHITQIRLGEIELPDFHPESPGTDTVYGFVLRDGDDCILFDTGIGTGSTLIDRLYHPKQHDLASALNRIGVALTDITAVANSHLHFDHCGNNRLFPEVPIFVQQTEWDAAKAPSYTIADWVNFPKAAYVRIEGRFPMTQNLELIPTPGHTPGHQSLIIRSGRTVEIIVAQAAYTSAEFSLSRSPNSDGSAAADSSALEAAVKSNATWSKQAYLSSQNRLRNLRPVRAFFSHDERVWERTEDNSESNSS